MRRGDSKATSEPPARSAWARAETALSPPLGRKPRKVNLSVGRPEATNAVEMEEGPGSTVMGMPSSAHRRSRGKPGSDRPGIPASETTATSLPSRRVVTRCSTLRVSLKSWKLRSSAPVSYTHLRAHETDSYLVCRLLLEKKKKTKHEH